VEANDIIERRNFFKKEKEGDPPFKVRILDEDKYLPFYGKSRGKWKNENED